MQQVAVGHLVRRPQTVSDVQELDPIVVVRDLRMFWGVITKATSGDPMLRLMATPPCLTCPLPNRMQRVCAQPLTHVMRWMPSIVRPAGAAVVEAVSQSEPACAISPPATGVPGAIGGLVFAPKRAKRRRTPVEGAVSGSGPAAAPVTSAPVSGVRLQTGPLVVAGGSVSPVSDVQAMTATPAKTRSVVTTANGMALAPLLPMRNAAGRAGQTGAVAAQAAGSSVCPVAVSGALSAQRVAAVGVEYSAGSVLDGVRWGGDPLLARSSLLKVSA